MAADTAAPVAVLGGVMSDQRRSLALWSLALAAIATMYIGIYPAMGVEDMSAMVENLPEAMVNAFGYDEIATPAGYITSTVYGLLGPILLSVFAIATGTRLVAGQEEDGTLELELTAPVGRARVLLERLGALWLNVAVLVGVLMVVTIALVIVLDLDVVIGNVVAGSVGMLLLLLGVGTVGLAVGAITGRRAIGLGVAAAFGVGAFMLDAIGPTVDADWMTAVSPFSLHLEERPLFTGFDWSGLAKLAAVPVVAAVAGVVGFARRDLMT
jgi:ABC-2 type transport system permease protein